MLAGLVTGIFHTTMGIPAILAGILTQLGLYSINLRIMGNKANVALVTDKYDVLVSMRYLKNVVFYKNTLFVVAVIIAVLIVILYWFSGRSWAAPSVLPVPMKICPAHRVSIPI